MKDKNGRPWATVAEVKPGSIVEADGGFDCLVDGKQYTVYSYPNDRLSIPCAKGSHFLDGQLDDTNTYYIGLYFVR
jgi:hypothetical protein